MSKPGTVPTWDSNSTHLISITGGHGTDGFAANEKPASTEMNGLYQLIGLWAAFVDSLFDSTGRLLALTTPRWRWVPGTAATGVQFATPALGSSAGLFGAIGQSNVGLFAVDLPVGQRMTKCGVRLCHAAGESPGVVALVGLYRSNGQVQGNPNVELISASPAASNPAYTIAVEHSATSSWDHQEVTLSSSGDKNLVANGYTYMIAVIFAGAIQIESVGVESYLEA
jgi:hypothetical protein